MKIPLLAAACLGLVTGCAFVGAPPSVSGSLAIAAADTTDPLDRAKGFTHLAFVIDTSGSMRDPRSGKLWPVVAQTAANVLATHPEIQWIQWLDTAGGTRFGRRDEWVPCDRDTTDRLLFMLENSVNAGVSNPVPALLNALTLPLPQGPRERIHICVIGDEATGEVAGALRAIEQINPPNGSGGWRATISAVQVPSIILPGGRMGKTGTNFESLMSTLATEYGGSFRMLADVDRL